MGVEIVLHVCCRVDFGGSVFHGESDAVGGEGVVESVVFAERAGKGASYIRSVSRVVQGLCGERQRAVGSIFELGSVGYHAAYLYAGPVLSGSRRVALHVGRPSKVSETQRDVATLCLRGMRESDGRSVRLRGDASSCVIPSPNT